MNDEQKTLARQLVALGQKDEKYFRDFPEEMMWFYEGEGESIISKYAEVLWEGPRWPDFRSPATAGCLWEILCELSGDNWIDRHNRNRSTRLPLSEVYRDGILYTSGECPGEAIARAIVAIAKAEGVEP